MTNATVLPVRSNERVGGRRRGHRRKMEILEVYSTNIDSDEEPGTEEEVTDNPMEVVHETTRAMHHVNIEGADQKQGRSGSEAK